MNAPSLARLIPAFSWLRAYERSWLRTDIFAGITLAAYLLPAGLGDASLANLPPEAGLYACLFGGLVFWLFCSSRHTVVTVTSAISLLVGASLGEIAGGDTTRFGALAAGTALLVAFIAFIAWLVKAGVIVNFISESVMTGFKCGVALFLASTQLPKLFGFHGAHGDFWENSGHFFKHLHETNPTSLLVGGTALAVLILGKIFLKNKPVSLFVVIGGIVAASALSLGERGVKLLGNVPQGLPPIGLPAVYWHDLNELLPLAFACFMLGAVETAAIGRMFTAKHGGRFDANQEFLALAASNSGRRTRSRISDQRRHVAIARQRRGRCTHTAVRRARCRNHFSRRALLLPFVKCVAPAGTRSRGACRSRGIVQALDPQTALAR